MGTNASSICAMPMQLFHENIFRLLKRSEAGVNFVGRFVRFNHLLFAAVFLLSAFSFWLSYEFRFDFNVPRGFALQRFLWMPYVAALKLGLFYLLKGHATSWRYIGLHDLPRLVLFCFLCSMTLVLIPIVTGRVVIPRGVILIDFLLSLVLIGGARIGLRFMREKIRAFLSEGQRPATKDAVVIGAGDGGEMILREIARNPRSGLRVQALFDDDVTRRGLSIHGVKVVGGVEDVPAYVQNNPVQMAVIAIPSADKAQMGRIYRAVKGLNLSVKTLPSLHEIYTGSSKLTQLRDLNITDLLGREEITIDSRQVEHLIADRVVAVTGAGGSIGSELCRQVLKRKPRRLVLIERSENNLFHIHRQLVEQAGTENLTIPLLSDVNDYDRITYEFERFRPDLVFHAAAYKHVPMQELNPVECFRNNVGGTRALARIADRSGVSTFLLISTDKAVNPSSVMGATKRVCEIYCQAFGRISRTRFLSVRFGNVLASDGSVVPLFLDQIHKGGPVTVTHPEMRRYFMTIPEAVTLVLQAAALGDSGQILVLEMGDPIKIVDMVHQLMQLVGKEPDEIPIQFVGIRPGEKLFEEVCVSVDCPRPTSHSKIRVFDPNSDRPEEAIERIERAIELVSRSIDAQEVRRILKEIVPEYEPEPCLQADSSVPDVAGTKESGV